MDINTIVSIISGVGFPITCCIYLIMQHTKEQERNMEEIEKLRVTVENNTKVMWAICSKLGIELEIKEDGK